MRPFVRILVLALAAACACATVTRLPLTWRDPGYTGGPFHALFVIGVAQSQTSRRLFEDRFAAALRERGVTATPSYDRLPETDRLDEARIRAALGDGHQDGVVVTRLLGVEEQTTYVPPRTHSVPRAYGGLYGYYGYAYDVVHQPGYTTKNTTVRLETNLYAVTTAKLVWSGQSETFDPRSVEDLIGSATQAVAAQLAEQKLLP